MQVLFSQRVKFNRALGLHGDLFANTKRPVVDRAVMVVKSEQKSSVMVQRGMPYVAFITANEAFHGDIHPQSHFFATPEAAIAFAKSAIANHPAIAAEKLA